VLRHPEALKSKSPIARVIDPTECARAGRSIGISSLS
jgi:hypothetical protein